MFIFHPPFCLPDQESNFFLTSRLVIDPEVHAACETMLKMKELIRCLKIRKKKKKKKDEEEVLYPGQSK